MTEERPHQFSPVCATPTAKNNLYVQALDHRDNLKTKEDLEKFRKNKPLWELIIV